MEPETSKKDYLNHHYSGPRKSRKRSRGQMKRYHGKSVSREEVWSKKQKLEHITNKENVRCLSAPVVQDPIRTYRSSKGHNIKLEASYEAMTPKKTVDQTLLTKTSSPLDIKWPLIDPTVNSHELIIETVKPDNLSGLSGHRIVDLPHVLQWAFSLERHRFVCESSTIKFVGELKNGFHSTFQFVCTMCGKQFRHSNEEQESLNKAFVWGAITAGSYYTQASHITNLMDIPTMSPNNFRRTEKELGEVWQDRLTEEIRKNGEEEKSLALECNNISADGIPYVDVVVDGGWPKRTYGHDYSSASGMVILFSLNDLVAV